MAISGKMQESINKQINAEMYSAYLYLSMAAYFESANLKGFASWMRVQVQEEMFHATKFYDYLLQRGGGVKLGAIDAPPDAWKSPLDVFEFTYQHEQKVTGLINNLVNTAISESDHATNNFLQWFVSEQVEEEESASNIVGKIKLMKDAPGGMFLLDQELGQRVFTPPVKPGKTTAE